MGSLTCGGHQYFGPWYEHHDPYKHDCITGPAEEFVAETGSETDYAEADDEAAFLRLGVGLLCKEGPAAFRRFHTYRLIDPGEWKIDVEREGIDFQHQVEGVSGVGYIYKKSIRLAHREPVLFLHHSLTNSGRRRMDIRQYNHNFFTIDQQPSGPPFAIHLPWPVQSVGPTPSPLQLSGNQIRFDRMMERDESVLAELTGYGSTAADYDITVVHQGTGAGVRIRGDKPIARFVFWAKRQTICPEPYIRIVLEPGEQTSWTISYRFFNLRSGVGNAGMASG
ncbi:MAG: hypothetical protein ABI380_03320 [Edaphobacter sp.]